MNWNTAKSVIEAIGIVKLTLDKYNGQYILKFSDDNDNIVKMPESTYSLKNSKTGEIIMENITVKDGQAIFNISGDVNLDEIYILNPVLGIVNKPKANLTLSVKGSNYLDSQVIMSLKNDTLSLGGEKIWHCLKLS